MFDECVKGFRDIDGQEAWKREIIRRRVIDIFEKYGYEAAETPIIEYENFVKGENLSDEAVSDIFKLKDRGDRKLALRYEFTFQLKRLAKNKKLPFKRYQIGSVFRDEPISGNRFREFTQCDVDIVGSSIKDEAELISIANEVFNSLGIKFTIYINNRKILNEILDELNINDDLKSGVLREIDKLDKNSEFDVHKNLEKYGASGIIKILKNDESYFRKYKSFSEVLELKESAKLYGVEVKFQPFLVRGLSYYNGSIFEIKSDIKETISAGGSFLVNGVSSCGISFGLDRLAIVSKLNANDKKTLIISLEQDKKAIEIASKLRKKGNKVIIMYGKPSKALEFANSKEIEKVIFVGEDEVKSKKFKVKDMKSGKEKKLDEKELTNL